MTDRYQILWTEKTGTDPAEAFGVRGFACSTSDADVAHRAATVLSQTPGCGSVRIVDVAQFGAVIARYVDGERITLGDTADAAFRYAARSA